MVLKREKDFWLRQILMASLFLCAYLMLLGIGIPFIWVFPLIVVFSAMQIGDFVSTGRRIIMDEQGCTVCLGKLQKTYTWTELKTKRIEKHYLPSMMKGYYHCPYRDEAIFAPHKIHKPRFIRGNLYSSLLHPFSCIYVHFSVGEKWTTGRYYEVDEQEFRAKMKQWGVELEERK